LAVVDTYMPLNMLNGFDFSNLGTGTGFMNIQGGAGYLGTYHSGSDTADVVFGHGFELDSQGLLASLAGTITEYRFEDGTYGNLVDIYGISVSFSSIWTAALSPSRADDVVVVRTALAGNDTILGSDYADVLDGFNGNDAIYGYAGNDAVYGEAGNDYLSGMNGNDNLNGAAGADTLLGGGGNDVLYGGAGKDTLAGGAGYDYFVFNTGLNATTNVDRITDFNVAQDTIRLENAVMPGLGSHLGTLASTAFWKSTTGLAHDSNDRVIYETDTGWLNYDSNGSGAGGAVHIALLAPNLGVTYGDFVVI
jgi:Ca2+-binding RTX toxin-like protein